MYEGEVIELSPEFTHSEVCSVNEADVKLPRVQGAGYGKVVNHVVIGLKTVKGTKQLRLDPTIYDSLQKVRDMSLSELSVRCRRKWRWVT